MPTPQEVGTGTGIVTGVLVAAVAGTVLWPNEQDLAEQARDKEAAAYIELAVNTFNPYITDPATVISNAELRLQELDRHQFEYADSLRPLIEQAMSQAQEMQDRSVDGEVWKAWMDRGESVREVRSELTDLRINYRKAGNNRYIDTVFWSVMIGALGGIVSGMLAGWGYDRFSRRGEVVRST